MNREEAREDRAVEKHLEQRAAWAAERDTEEDAEVMFWRRLREGKRREHARGEHAGRRVNECSACEQM